MHHQAAAFSDGSLEAHSGDGWWQQARRMPRHVLVVEDEGPIRDLLTDVLRDHGYTVSSAADGIEALQKLETALPDLIVLDLMLPRVSGWRFLERSRDQLGRASTPVLIVSAIDGRSDYPRALGAAAWLTKPVEIDRFLGTVEQLAGPSRPRD
jgi:DNA-binding response OmpR family regulator